MNLELKKKCSSTSIIARYILLRTTNPGCVDNVNRFRFYPPAVFLPATNGKINSMGWAGGHEAAITFNQFP